MIEFTHTLLTITTFSIFMLINIISLVALCMLRVVSNSLDTTEFNAAIETSLEECEVNSDISPELITDIRDNLNLDSINKSLSISVYSYMLKLFGGFVVLFATYNLIDMANNSIAYIIGCMLFAAGAYDFVTHEIIEAKVKSRPLYAISYAYLLGAFGVILYHATVGGV